MAKTTLELALNEMVRHAAEEIGFEHDDENVQMVIMDLYHDYGIELDLEGPITVDIMRVICDVIEDWKENTRTNAPKLHVR